MAGSDAQAKALPEDAECDFVISRVFDAPRELVFEAWTEAKYMRRWWGPRTVTNPVCEMDVRPGGAYRITMRMPDGSEYPITGVFKEVVRPERLVMTLEGSGHPKEWHDKVLASCAEQGSRGYDEKNPVGDVLCIITFEKLGEKTKVTVRQRFISAAIRNAMVKLGMDEGWMESLDKLAELLKRGGAS
jgi:uncharacterized protein YndB with AHSA1/START domain